MGIGLDTVKEYLAKLRKKRSIAAHVPPDKVILDIGAFEGEYALAAREVNQGAKIFAFEPNPHSIQTLRPTCIAKNVCLVEAAVAEKEGTLTFVCSAAQSRIAGEENPECGTDEKCTVAAVSLDSWTTTNTVVPALIKIDVEAT